jgi:hypothetical protein
MAPQKKRSKKRSDARSSSSAPLNGATFFLDESILSSALRTALLERGAVVELLTQHFASGTRDDVWLSYVGKRQWIVLTKDTRIRYRRVEQAALLRHRAKVFVYIGGSVTGTDMAATINSVAHKLVLIARSEPAPFIYSIGKAGSLVRIS